MAEAVHSLRPCALVLVDCSKANLYRIHTPLFHCPRRERHVPILGSVADHRQLREVFEGSRPEIIYHAAAFKHLPLDGDEPLCRRTE